MYLTHRRMFVDSHHASIATGSSAAGPAISKVFRLIFALGERFTWEYRPATVRPVSRSRSRLAVDHAVATVMARTYSIKILRKTAHMMIHSQFYILYSSLAQFC